MAKIVPTDTFEFKFKQPKTQNPAVARLPSSVLAAAPSASGKSTAILYALLSPEMYRGCFSRIYVFSNSILPDGRLLDKSYEPLVEYVQKELKVDTSREQCFFNADPKSLMDLINQWQEISELWKSRIKNGSMVNMIKGACLIADDVSDNPAFARHSPAIQTLAMRARHICITLPIYSLQKLRTINQAVRVNVRSIWFWRARSAMEYKAIVEEVGNFVTEQEFKALYTKATAEPHSFLNIRLDQPVENMFFKNFEVRLSSR